jgi:hypothetical protein
MSSAGHNGVVRSVMRSPAVMCSLVIITDACLLIVTGHDLSPIHPLAFRLS